MNRVILKFNQSNELYHYTELSPNDKMLSYYAITGQKLIRFNESLNAKESINYKQPIKLNHKILNGENFVSICNNCDIVTQYDTNEIDKHIKLIDNNVISCNFDSLISKVLGAQ